MKNLATTLMAAIAAIIVASSAHATVVNFDDVSVQNGAWVPAGYDGLNWSNFAVATSFSYGDVNTTGMGTGVGYRTGVFSGVNTAFNSGGLLGRVSSDSDFDFHGAYFTSAWSDLNVVTAKGYNNGHLIYTKTLAIDTKGSKWFGAAFNDIDELTLMTSSWQFAMDNFDFEFNAISAPPAAGLGEPRPAPVPEPSTMLLLTAGVVGVGLARKRKGRL